MTRFWSTLLNPEHSLGEQRTLLGEAVWEHPGLGLLGEFLGLLCLEGCCHVYILSHFTDRGISHAFNVVVPIHLQGEILGVVPCLQ